MIKSDKKSYLLLSIIFFIFFLLLFKCGGGFGADELYYYTPLTSLFYDRDINLTNDLTFSNNHFQWTMVLLKMIAPTGLAMDGFPIGSPFLWFPFFLVVRLYAFFNTVLSGNNSVWITDRFSNINLLSISFASFFYGYLTVLLMYRICRFFFRPLISLYAVITTFFGSNLLYYVFVNPFLSHLSSAFSASLLTFLCIKHRKLLSSKDYVLIFSAMALAVIVNFQNVIFALIPFIFCINRLRIAVSKNLLKEEIRKIFPGVLFFLSIYSVQILFFYAIYGRFTLSPREPGFMQWFNPKIYKTLFWGWNGLFYYSPVLIFSIIGLLFFLSKNRHRKLTISFIIIWLSAVYLNSCPADWYAGGSFGARRFCGSYPVFCIGICMFFHIFKKRFYYIPGMISISSVLLNYFIIILYGREIITLFFWREIFAIISISPMTIVKVISHSILDSFVLLSWISLKEKGASVIYVIIGAYLMLATYEIIFSRINKIRLLITVFICMGIISLLFSLCIYAIYKNPDPDLAKLYTISPLQTKVPREEKIAAVKELLDKKMQNEFLVTYAPEFLGKENIHEYYSLMQEMNPKFYCKWIVESRNSGVTQEKIDSARRFLKKDPIVLKDIYANFISEYRRYDNNTQKDGLEKAIRDFPYDIWFNKTYISYLKSNNDTNEYIRIRNNLKKFLLIKMDSFHSAKPHLENLWYETLYNSYTEYNNMLHEIQKEEVEEKKSQPPAK